MTLVVVAVAVWAATRWYRSRHDRRRRLGALVAVVAILAFQVALGSPVAFAQDCGDAPAPERPTAGMVAALDAPRPTHGLPGSVYGQYGYAGQVWHVYEDTCSPLGAAAAPRPTIDTWIGNQLFDIGKNLVAATNGLHYALAYDELMGPLDQAITGAASLFYNTVYTGLFGLALLIVAVWLFKYIWRGDLATTARKGIWVLVAMWTAASFLLIGPLYKELEQRFLVKTTQIQAGFVADNASQADLHALPEALHDWVVYRNWLRGEFGSEDAPEATQYGLDLVGAQAWSKFDSTDTTDQAALDAKTAKYKEIAGKLGPTKGYFEGSDGNRAGAGILALLQGIFYSLFQLVVKLGILLAQVLLRIFVLATPLIGLIAILQHELLRKVARAAAAVILNVLVLAALAGMHMLLLNAIFNADGLPTIAVMALAALITVVFYVIARPLRRIWQMLELSVSTIGAAVPAAQPGSWFTWFGRRRSAEPTPDEQFWQQVRDGGFDESEASHLPRRDRPEANTLVIAAARRLVRQSAQTHSSTPTGTASPPALPSGTSSSTTAAMAMVGATAVTAGRKELVAVGVKALGVQPTGTAPVRVTTQSPRETAQPPTSMRTESDPVNVATGEVIVAQTDVELPGALPLVVSRTHLSSYRTGRWLGPSWTSIWDERLEVDTEGVIFFRVDGVVLFYPHSDGQPVFPVEGPRWLLTPTEQGYRVTDPDTGRAWRFETAYGTTVPVTAITDRAGHRIEFDYDTTGTPIMVRHSGGYRIRVDTTDGRITALYVVDSRVQGGEIELIRYRYTDTGQLSEVSNSSGLPLQFTYDTQGRITRWEDRNNHWYTYTYDNQGRCVRNDSSSGYLTGTFTYGPSDDIDDGLPEMTEESERVTVYTDATGHPTTFHINKLGQVIREIDPLGNETHTAWDRYDRLLERADPLGRVTSYRYDETGNLIRIVRPDGTNTIAVHNAMRLPTMVVDPDGAVWRRTYNDAGNLIELTDPAGATTRYQYDTADHLSAIVDAEGHTHTIRCNPAGLPIIVTNPLGATTTYTRDTFGRITGITDPLGNTTRMGWTTEGKPAWRTQPDGTTEHWRWDGEGNLIEHTNPVGGTTKFDYGAFDLPIAETRPDASRLTYSYDPALRLATVTNPLGHTWRYDYDPAGRLTRETDFTGRQLHYSHNKAGDLVERTNGAGETTTYTRDRLGRITERRSDDRLTRYAYDPAGRLTRATNPDTELTYQRDPLGRVLAETLNGRTVHSTYDTLGRRTSRTTPIGQVSNWEYNPAGHPTALHTAGHTLTFSHDKAGRESARRLGPNVLLTQAWDANHRLTEQTLTTQPSHSAPSSIAPGRTLQHREFHYRPDGYITDIKDQLAGDRHFDLDQLGQIKTVHGTGWAERYAYDTNGNITAAAWPDSDTDTQGTRTYTTDLLNTAGTTRYTHDAQGRLIRRQKKRLSHKPDTWHYTWNTDDQLTTVTTPDSTTWYYTYDPRGRRTSKYRLAPDGTPAERIEFTWDSNTLAEQHTASGHILTWDYEPGTFRPLTQSERNRDPASQSQEWFDQTFYAIITDLIGTPTDLIDQHGNHSRHQHTTLWGHTHANPGPHTFTPLRFPGQYHDTETGLHYNHHRYYDPDTGRYISHDRLGLIGGLNPQVYVHNSITWIDPLGLMGDSASKDPDTPQSLPRIIYRGGDPSPSNLKLRPGEDALSFRDSLSNPLPPGTPVFHPGKSYFGIDTSKLDPAVIVPDGVPGSATTPPGHVSVYVGDWQKLKNAVIERGKFPK